MTESRVFLEARCKNPVGKEQLTMEESSCADGERKVPEKAEGAGVWTAGEQLLRPEKEGRGRRKGGIGAE